MSRFLHVFIFAAAFLVLTGSFGQAQQPPLIPREIIFGDPEIASPAISPDGGKLAYLAPFGGLMSLFVRPVAPEVGKLVVRAVSRGIHRYVWQQDSRHVLYLQDSNGDENWHVFQADTESEQIRDLTPFEGKRVEIVGMSPGSPNEALLAINKRSASLNDLYRLALDTGDLTLEMENPGDVVEWHSDRMLRVIAATTVRKDGGGSVIAICPKSGERKTAMEWGPEESSIRVAGFSPDSRSVYLISSVGHNAARLLEIDLESSARKVVVEDPNFDVYRVFSHPESRSLQAAQVVRERTEWVFLDKGFESDVKFLESLADGVVNVLSRSLRDRFWVVSFTSDLNPARYYLYDRQTRVANYLFSERPSLDGRRMARLEPVSFSARDGMLLHGYIMFPPGIIPANLPLVVRVHGGPWLRHTWNFNEEAQWLANRGYAVLEVNFRGSAGYGKDYLNAGNREWGGKILTDLIDGKKWAVDKGYADPKRVGIYGCSFGGYAVLASMAFTPNEFACGAEFAGPSNLVTLIESFPPYWAGMRPVFEKRVGHPERDRRLLESQSPLFAIESVRSPLLIAHGANDPRVKCSESEQIAKVLSNRSVPFKYLLFENEGHYLSRADNRMKFYAAVEQFFSECLGGRFEPHEKREQP